VTKFCTSVDIEDVITCATFCDDRLWGLGVARGRISRFPIDLRRRPYNTLALPCECVIFSRHAVNYHLLADDKQLSESDKVSDTSDLSCIGMRY